MKFRYIAYLILLVYFGNVPAQPFDDEFDDFLNEMDNDFYGDSTTLENEFNQFYSSVHNEYTGFVARSEEEFTDFLKTSFKEFGLQAPESLLPKEKPRNLSVFQGNTTLKPEKSSSINQINIPDHSFFVEPGIFSAYRLYRYGWFPLSRT
ncbi:MAG: hypothetical protein HC906_15170 [Bacteroidales bacterium]|nr:hypothetical protein [Bacteroidales bacterium]